MNQYLFEMGQATKILLENPIRNEVTQELVRKKFGKCKPDERQRTTYEYSTGSSPNLCLDEEENRKLYGKCKDGEKEMKKSIFSGGPLYKCMTPDEVRRYEGH
jgi:hypothetical protein